MSRNFQSVRVLKLLFLFATHRRTGLTIKQLTELLGVKRRTLYRDLEALKEAGVEFTQIRSDGELKICVKRIPALLES